ncbi:MAG: hypothetical protein WED85_12980 [Dehalococcoidia bacterium]
MLAAVYLLTLSLAGIAAVTRLLPTAPPMVRIAGGFVAGIAVTAWLTYLIALGLSSATDESLLIGIVVAIAVNIAVIAFLASRLRLGDFRLARLEIVLIGLALVFSFWLMDQRLTVEHDQPGDPVVVSANTWGDTALHTALARSFSWGENYPTEYPFYANEPIRYHFGYDFFAGALEEGGFNVPYAFNLPGALGFTAMMMLLFSIARMLFYSEGADARAPWWRNKGIWVGLIAVCVLMTNQSLEFLRWFDPSPDTPRYAYHLTFTEALKPANWWDHSGYLSIGPYYSDKIAIFNTLNVFLTQTHLIIGMALVLFVAFGLIEPLRRGRPLERNRMLLLGVTFGLSFWLNGVLYIASGVFFGSLLVIFALAGAFRHAQVQSPDRRGIAFASEFWRWSKAAAWFIVPALALAIPQAIWLNGGLHNDGSFQTHLGYLVCSSPNAGCHGVDSIGQPEMDLLSLPDWGEFVNYWLLNEGLVFPILIIAAIIGRRSDWKILAAVMAVFVFGSLFQLSRDLGGHNHKIFNLWEILAAPFIGYVFVEVWNIGRGRLGALQIPSMAATALGSAAFALVPVVFLFLVLSGLLDFMTIKNDFKTAVFGDNEPVIEWIDDNLPRDAVVLTSWGDLYTAPTLAGRGVYLGYDAWAGSAGYDVAIRQEFTRQMYGAADKGAACGLLQREEIDYVQIGNAERSSGRFTINENLFAGEFTTKGTVNDTRGNVFTYYDVAASCGG